MLSSWPHLLHVSPQTDHLLPELRLLLLLLLVVAVLLLLLWPQPVEEQSQGVGPGGVAQQQQGWQ